MFRVPTRRPSSLPDSCRCQSRVARRSLYRRGCRLCETSQPAASVRAYLYAMTHPLGEAPYTGTLQLYGCNRVNNAAFYRIKYSYNGAPAVPFVGLTWPVNKIVGGMVVSHWPAPMRSGWYPVLPAADGWFPTCCSSSGAPPISPMDYHSSRSNLAMARRMSSEPPPQSGCASITQRRTRGVHRSALAQVRRGLGYRAGSPYLRSDPARRGPGGHRGRDFVLGIGEPSAFAPRSAEAVAVPASVLISHRPRAQHWHTNTADNSVASTARFSISAAAAPGAYSFNLIATSRAFNPSAGDGVVTWSTGTTIRSSTTSGRHCRSQWSMPEPSAL